MRIQCSSRPQGVDSSGNFRYWVIDLEDGTPGLQYVSRPEGIGRGVLGTELDRAQVHYGDWTDCPRENEEATEKRLATLKAKCDCVKLQVKLKAVTAQRDWLLKACKRAREFISNMSLMVDYKFPIMLSQLDDAIADVEETR